MKRALITGGAGFIGYHLALQLINKSYKVDLIDNFSRGVRDRDLEKLLNHQYINFVDLNLLDSDAINNIENCYDYIFHFAALVGVSHVSSAPYQVLVNNFKLLDNVIASAKKQKKLSKFIFTSTSEVYSGTLKYFGLEYPTNESTPLCSSDLNVPRTSYMLSKIYGEAMCLQSGLPVTIVRPHNFYGPRMGMSHVIPELMKKTRNANNGIIDVYSADHTRTFCFIEDGVKMIMLVAESDKTTGNTYNIGNENEEISMEDLAYKIAHVIGRKLRVNPLPETPGSPKRRCPDMSKFYQITKFENNYSLDSGLIKTYEWYNNNVFTGNEVSAI